MILSTRGRYGLKAMYELTLHHGDGPTPLKEIAQNQNLSESYLEQLFLVLRKEELIESVRGAHGGYMLSRDPVDITVGEILRCLEGSLSPSACVDEESESACTKEDNCATKQVWLEIKNSIDNVVDTMTLKDMLRKNNDLGEAIHE